MHQLNVNKNGQIDLYEMQNIWESSLEMINGPKWTFKDKCFTYFVNLISNMKRYLCLFHCIL